MNPTPNREVVVFNAALALPASQRDAYLEEACADDPALRVRIEDLLRVHEQAGPFMETVVPEAQAAPNESGEQGATINMTLAPSEKPGDRIGRYKLLQQIGEGGCGVVYMAEQEEPVRRRVALKVIKLGMDTKQVIARFEAERQALALMDHPNIAKVFDAGATETGRPYFVMELIKGIPITRYCDENNLSTVTRLGLFVQVCQAIQHAHQKGIIHRDIKPSNVLVADHDGVPVPKIIDFGIAKATTDQRLTDTTLFTAFEQFIGTPAYMSPEQAKLSGLDVDTRSDIYSLGVLLYELLTGKTPFEAKRLLEAGLDEVRRIIRDEEPLRPSTRLTNLEATEQTTVAKHRQADPRRLAYLIRGDLDWIVMKCLEKDRGRRYETANGLAMDLQRHLNNEPVVARSPNWLYRLRKSARRNKTVFVTASAVVGVLVVAAIASTAYAIKATRAEKHATAEAARSQQVLAFLVNILGSGTDLLVTDDRAITVHTFTHLRPEDLGQAEAMFTEVLALQKKKFGAKSEETARTLSSLASLQEDRGQLDQAELTRWKVISTLTELSLTNSSPFVMTLHCLAELAKKRGDLPAAQDLHKRAIEISVTDGLSRAAELELVSSRGELYARFSLYKEAVPDLARAVQLEPTNHLYYYVLAPVLIETGDLAEYRKLSELMLSEFAWTTNTVLAERTARTCLLLPGTNDLRPVSRLAEIANENAGPNDPDLSYFQFVKALAEYRMGQNAAAIEWAEKSIKRGASWAGSFNYSREVVTYAVEAMAHHRLRQVTEAKASLSRAKDIMEREGPKRGGSVRGTLLVDWLTCRILLSEASTLIQEDPSRIR